MSLFLHFISDLAAPTFFFYTETWPDALAVQARPSEVSHSFKNYSEIADIIWRAAGDTSTDLNWYTKRGSVVCVYIATEMHILTDKSEDFGDTWKFLQRRIDDVMELGKYSKHSLSFGKSILDALIQGPFKQGTRGQTPTST